MKALYSVLLWLGLAFFAVSGLMAQPANEKESHVRTKKFGKVIINNEMGKDIEVEVEIAADSQSRAYGLMFRRHLPANMGMLFIFEKSEKPAFWMKNTYIPLSLAYINKNQEITQIYKMQPESSRLYSSDHQILYALEVNRGFFQKNLIFPGAKVRFAGIDGIENKDNINTK